MLDNNFQKNKLRDVICENGSVVNGKITKLCFDKFLTLQTPPMVLRILLQIKHDNWKTKSSKKNLRMEITSEYPFNFPQEMENVTYTLVFVNDHDGNSMSPGHYLCDILDFNTGI